MLSVIPVSWCSWSYRIEDHSQTVAQIDMAWIRERADVHIGKEKFRCGRNSFVRGTFELRHDGEIIATGKKRSLFRTFDVKAGGRHFELSAVSLFGRTMRLHENGRPLGTMSPVGIWSRKARVKFPESLPLDVRVFLIWLVLILWRRAASSDAAAG